MLFFLCILCLHDTSVYFKLVSYHCCLFMKWSLLVATFKRLLLPDFKHSGRCSNTKHEQVPGGLGPLVPMQGLPPIT